MLTMHLNKPIEVVSGSGRLTATIRKMDDRAVVMDRSTSRTSGPATTLDLTKPDALEFLKNFIVSELDILIYVHMAPPRGTCSAARQKRHRDLEAAGFQLPKPVIGVKLILWGCVRIVVFMLRKWHAPTCLLWKLLNCACNTLSFPALRTACFGTLTPSRSFLSYVHVIATCRKLYDGW